MIEAKTKEKVQFEKKKKKSTVTSETNATKQQRHCMEVWNVNMPWEYEVGPRLIF